MPTEPTNAEPPKCNRRWFQFSLRTLLIVTVVVAVIAGGLGRGIENDRRESEVVKAVTSIGGCVYYDYERSGGGWSFGPEPNGPRWLRAIFGENFFSEVALVGLSDTIVTDTDLPAIEKNMTHVPEISAAGVKHLKAALPNCQVLTDG
jgi:hypothetical protein